MSSAHTLPRLYVASDKLDAASAGATCAMEPGQARYLGAVMRRGDGDVARIFNARIGEWRATISGLRKERGSFVLQEQLRPAPLDGEPGCVMAFALLKRDATDLAIRMGAELGVARFAPLITERTVGQRVNEERLAAIAIEAAEQCERLTVPVIDAPVRLSDFLGAWPAEKTLFAAVERLDARAGSASLERARPSRPFSGARSGDGVLIGPEGGFSDGELDVVLARPFVTALTLGERVLRADTAVAAAAALFDASLGNA
ncbi:16S rRNA (uracil(1498)-N(3))-methyltransferase [Acetobacter sacchari]|uniref:Ribosomal RNA small subunit methyltransferase E n=1 Tax=Acetobacter sacchari TaxID=2661687 RepID=A0ABS3M0H2_9PROT|nr:16S rRNA (uracil(1498)-N(3))-methyltransferase [Acetobacter sacchari]MBO1361625.1 16S rRNA (uracil(1498)-N(3))-methyltransferase [Acetobacter sacchari]